MAEQPLTAEPKIEWLDGELRVSLPMSGMVLDAKWRPNATSVIRIREVGTEEWSPGFETPLNACTFSGLKPDTEYEVELRQKDATGNEGQPSAMRMKTHPGGSAANVIPFPKR
jgi:hypothetical protein